MIVSYKGAKLYVTVPKHTAEGSSGPPRSFTLKSTGSAAVGKFQGDGHGVAGLHRGRGSMHIR
jgi:hypothetical protein